MFYRRSLKRRLLTWFSEQYLFKCDRCGRHRKHGFEFYLFRQRTVKQQSKMEADYTKRMNKLFESAVPLDRKSNIPEQHSQQMEQ